MYLVYFNIIQHSTFNIQLLYAPFSGTHSLSFLQWKAAVSLSAWRICDAEAVQSPNRRQNTYTSILARNPVIRHWCIIVSKSYSFLNPTRLSALWQHALKARQKALCCLGSDLVFALRMKFSEMWNKAMHFIKRSSNFLTGLDFLETTADLQYH